MRGERRAAEAARGSVHQPVGRAGTRTVIALRGDESLATMDDGIKWRASGDDGAAVGERVDFGGSDLA